MSGGGRSGSPGGGKPGGGLLKSGKGKPGAPAADTGGGGPCHGAEINQNKTYDTEHRWQIPVFK